MMRTRHGFQAAALLASLFALLALSWMAGASPGGQSAAPTLVPPTLVPTVESAAVDALPSESGVARIQRDATVRVGILFNEPQFGELNARGEVSGFDADLARALAEAWSVEVEFAQVTRQTAIDTLLSGDVDVLIAAQAHRRELDGLVEFSQTYYPDQQLMAVRQDDGASVLGHMADRKVGVVMGTPSEMAVAEWLNRSGLPVTVYRYLNLDQAVSALLAHEVDGVVEDRLRLQRAFPEPGTARFLEEPVGPQPFAVVMRRQDANLRQLVNRTLQYLVASGKMNEIHQRNFADAPYPAETFAVWSGLGDSAPTPSQLGADIPYPATYVVPRLQSERVLRVAGVADVPEDADESVRRLDAVNRAVAEAFGDRWGVTVQFIPNSAGNALELVASGQADLAVGVEPSWDWADRADFTQPYLVHGQRLMVPTDSEIEMFADLRGKWIGIFASEEGVRERVTELAEEARAIITDFFVIYNEGDAVFGMTAQNNYHAVFGDSLKLIPHVQANPDTVRLTTGGDYDGWYSRHVLAMAVPRNDVDFRLLVDYTLQELARDGTLTTLLQPVLLPEDTPRFDIWPGPSEYLGFRLDQVLGG